MVRGGSIYTNQLHLLLRRNHHALESLENKSAALPTEQFSDGLAVDKKAPRDEVGCGMVVRQRGQLSISAPTRRHAVPGF